MFPLINKQETGVNLRRIMDMRGIAPKDVQEYLGLGCVQSVYRWIDGVNMPTIDNLYALSELLQVPIDAIVPWQQGTDCAGYYCKATGFSRKQTVCLL